MTRRTRTLIDSLPTQRRRHETKKRMQGVLATGALGTDGLDKKETRFESNPCREMTATEDGHRLVRPAWQRVTVCPPLPGRRRTWVADRVRSRALQWATQTRWTRSAPSSSKAPFARSSPSAFPSNGSRARTLPLSVPVHAAASWSRCPKRSILDERRFPSCVRSPRALSSGSTRQGVERRQKLVASSPCEGVVGDGHDHDLIHAARVTRSLTKTVRYLVQRPDDHQLTHRA